MTMKNILFALAMVAGLSSWAGGKSGSSEGSAPTLQPGATSTVSLVPEYDEDFETEDPNTPVYYAKIKLTRGKAYTVYADKADEGIEVIVDQGWSTPFEEMSSATFMPETVGGQEYQILYEDSWYYDPDYPEDSDPATATYFIMLTGSKVGDKATIHFQEGVFLPQGLQSNPRPLTPSMTDKTDGPYNLIDGQYFYSVTVKAGRKYLFATANGTESSPLLISSLDASGTVKPYASWATANNASVSFVPFADTKAELVVASAGTDDASLTAPFALRHQLLKNRTLAEHDSTAVAVGDTVTVKPGYKNAPNTGAYDEIIDECLYSLNLAKGQRIVVQTSGAATDLLLRIYDKNGNVVKEGELFAEGNDFDLRCAYEAAAAGAIYVGLCEKLDDEDVETPTYAPVELKILSAAGQEGVPDKFDPVDDEIAGATALMPIPGKKGEDPLVVDSAERDSHRLGATDWGDIFMIGARKDLTYVIKAQLVDSGRKPVHRLGAMVFTMNGKTEKVVAVGTAIDPSANGTLEFKATANGTYYVRVYTVNDAGTRGDGFDYPDYTVHAMAYSTSGDELGILTVNLLGADGAQWNLQGESVKFESGASILVAGKKTVVFGKATGFNAEKASEEVTVAPGTTPTVVDCHYNDTSDPKDDVEKGAVALSISNKAKEYPRTLWEKDPQDCFSFSSKDGIYYDFALAGRTGNAVFTITNATADAEGKKVFVEKATSVSHLALPGLKTKYYLVVSHDEKENTFNGGKYTLTCSSANVGAIKFAKDKLSVKKNAGSVKLTVNRTAKEGRVRVLYGTVAGTAKPGERYVAQSGVLEWAANDNKAKTIEIKLLPDLVPLYQDATQFQVQLKAIDEADLAEDEYPAQITVDTCTVTLTESAAKTATSVEAAYAKSAPKLATVKTENVPLRTGTFYGVLAEDGFALTNGLPALASVTLTTTAKAGKPDTLSAKVALAGKTYTFKTNTKAPEEWEDLGDGSQQITLSLAQTVNKVVYTNTLTLVIKDGLTTNETDWVAAGGTAELVMNVPDANNKGAQEEIRYFGDIYRQNAKIQGYFNVVTNFTGYYTMALASEGVGAGDGLPDGNGYLTVKIDNKGKATVAGLLADGTKVSLSVTAAALKEDSESEIGYSMYLPIFVAKSPYCFGGTLRLYAKPGKTLPNKDFAIVVDSTQPLVWNNDNAALTYYNEEGWRLLCDPCGGWYDTVFNLQAYYLNYAFEVGCADITEFPTEIVASGYEVCMDAQPNAKSVNLVNDAFSTEKKSLVKDGKLYDLVNSVNPCNVQVKVARATGLVTGSFSLWSQSEDGTKQKEITGIKHNGILILSRDDFSPLGEDVAAAGFCQGKVKVVDEIPGTTRTTTRNWTYSLPFNLLAIDQGEVDWWADDWGEAPESED